ncbi:hypothetical protein Hanom_Chr13g01218921 [Helianthus anomalus]
MNKDEQEISLDKLNKRTRTEAAFVRLCLRMFVMCSFMSAHLCSFVLVLYKFFYVIFLYYGL